MISSIPKSLASVTHVMAPTGPQSPSEPVPSRPLEAELSSTGVPGGGRAGRRGAGGVTPWRPPCRPTVDSGRHVLSACSVLVWGWAPALPPHC